MTKEPYPSLSDRQLKTAEVLSRLEDQRSTRQMARWFFGVIVGVFLVNSGFLLYSAFAENGVAIKQTVMAAFDGLFGTLIGRVAWYLFPPRCKDAKGAVRELAPKKVLK